MRRVRRLACAASVAAALLGGCRVGPKYVKPTAPTPPEFKESSPATYNQAPDGTWRPANPQDAVIKGKWWEVFNEPELNGLEDQLNINNQNIAEYFQNFMAARAQVREARSQYFPTLAGGPSYTRSKTPSAERGAVAASTSGGNVKQICSLALDASWAPDLLGRSSERGAGGAVCGAGERCRSGERTADRAGHARGIVLRDSRTGCAAGSV